LLKNTGHKNDAKIAICAPLLYKSTNTTVLYVRRCSLLLLTE